MSAPKQVLSDEISRAIDGRRVVAAVFTTYSFDPAFFELEVLPLLFESRIKGGFSHQEKVRRVQLEECLRDGADIEVIYDRSGLVGDAGPASLDFRRIDAGRKAGVFHPKLLLVLIENPRQDSGAPTRSLMVATLSANLTRSGWWENLEAGHVEVIDAASRRNRWCTFREDLLAALDHVMGAVRLDDRRGALRAIHRFVEDEAPRGGTRKASWRGRYYKRLFVGQADLPDWLRDRRLGDRRWNLEVVSPYFDAHGTHTLTNLIRATQPSEVRVYLPTEPDGTPTVTGEQYQAVAELAKCKWCRLPASIRRSARAESSEGAAPRKVHAKVYRFWRRGEGDVTLVGSVNLTAAAHSRAERGNLEAAFLVNTADGSDRADWWLEPIDDPPAKFAEQLSTLEGDAERVWLALSLRYHWDRHALEYRLDDEHDGEVCLHSIAGEQLHTISAPVQGEWRDCGDSAADRVQDLLGSTSFVEARIQASDGMRAWRVLVREEGMTHKPSLLAQLTPEEILQYWSLLTESQKQAFIGGHLERDDVALGFAISSKRPSPESIPTVFDRFAGIFHAFEQLGGWVNEKLTQEREAEVTARLFGEKYDSLPVLLRKILEQTDRDAVVAYVTFLSASQAVTRVKRKWPSYWAKHGDDGQRLERILAEGREIRAAVPLKDADREEFLAWYEDSFLTDTAAIQTGGGRDK